MERLRARFRLEASAKGQESVGGIIDLDGLTGVNGVSRSSGDGASGLHQKTESDDSCGTDELLLVSLFATSPPAIRYHDTCTDGAQCQDRCLRGGGGMYRR
jgi:hypothetical protein